MLSKRIIFMFLMFFVFFNLVSATYILKPNKVNIYSNSSNLITVTPVLSETVLDGYSVYEEIPQVKNKLYQTIANKTIYADYDWNIGITGQNTYIGVVDSGIDKLQYYRSLAFGKNFCDLNSTDYNCDDPDGHGCLVASIIVGDENYKGVAYNAELKVAKVFDANGNDCVTGSGTSWNEVYDFITDISKVINNSYGAPFVDPNSCNYNSLSVLKSEIDYIDAVTLNHKDSLFVFAAGNEGLCHDENSLSMHAQAYNVLTVGAIDDNRTINRNDDLFANFSSKGPTYDGRKKPDVVAPGVNIISLKPHDSTNIDVWSGTSAATPFVTAFASLLYSQGLKPLEIKSLIINSAEDKGVQGWDKDYGWGEINVKDAQKDINNVFLDSSSVHFNERIDDLTELDLSYDSYAKVYKTDANKCTLVWNREYTNSGFYLENLDLYGYKDNNLVVKSDSNIDNVEQITGNFNFIKVVSNSQDHISGLKYALACNGDVNLAMPKIYLELDRNHMYDSYYDENIYGFYVTMHFKLKNDQNYLIDLNYDMNYAVFRDFYNHKSEHLKNIRDYRLDLNMFVPIFYPTKVKGSFYIHDLNLKGHFEVVFFDRLYNFLENVNVNVNVDKNVFYLNYDENAHVHVIVDGNYLVGGEIGDIVLFDYNTHYKDFNLTEHFEHPGLINCSSYRVYGLFSLDDVSINAYLGFVFDDNHYIDLYSPNFFVNRHASLNYDGNYDGNIIVSFTFGDVNKYLLVYDDGNFIDLNLNTSFILDKNKHYLRLIGVRNDENVDINFKIDADYVPILVDKNYDPQTKKYYFYIKDWDLNPFEIKVFEIFDLNDFDLNRELDYNYEFDRNTTIYTIYGDANAELGEHHILLKARDFMNHDFNAILDYNVTSESGSSNNGGGSSSSGGGGGGGGGSSHFITYKSDVNVLDIVLDNYLPGENYITLMLKNYGNDAAEHLKVEIAIYLNNIFKGYCLNGEMSNSYAPGDDFNIICKYDFNVGNYKIKVYVQDDVGLKEFEKQFEIKEKTTNEGTVNSGIANTDKNTNKDENISKKQTEVKDNNVSESEEINKKIRIYHYPEDKDNLNAFNLDLIYDENKFYILVPKDTTTLIYDYKGLKIINDVNSAKMIVPDILVGKEAKVYALDKNNYILGYSLFVFKKLQKVNLASDENKLSTVKVILGSLYYAGKFAVSKVKDYSVATWYFTKDKGAKAYGFMKWKMSTMSKAQLINYGIIGYFVVMGLLIFYLTIANIRKAKRRRLKRKNNF